VLRRIKKSRSFIWLVTGMFSPVFARFFQVVLIDVVYDIESLNTPTNKKSRKSKKTASGAQHSWRRLCIRMSILSGVIFLKTWARIRRGREREVWKGY
jgi:hypothetical protein